MAIQYKSNEERKLHANVIHSLADQYQIDASEIREVYERKLEQLAGNARVKSYLSLLAVRHVKSYMQELRRAD